MAPQDLHNDDQPVGRVLNRRELLTLFGSTGALLLFSTTLPRIVAAQSTTIPTPAATGTAVPACVVRPELTEGPYFVDGPLNRSDIRIDPSDDSVTPGLPLRLIFRVSDVTGGVCAPLAGAQVDIWHCDAAGVYSGVDSEGTADEMWLRGYQVTDESGSAEFITIYPGWYRGRTVHIHFKVRTDAGDMAGYEFTSQLFFPEDLSDLVFEEAPYTGRGYRNTLNVDEGIFRENGDVLTLDLVAFEDDTEAGYSATFDIGLDLSDANVGASDSAG